MKTLRKLRITAVYEDGSSDEEVVNDSHEFMSDIFTAIRLQKSPIDTLIYLANLGSKAITGINPKAYENGIKTYLGDTRNINSMIRGRFVPEVGKNMTLEDEIEMALLGN